MVELRRAQWSVARRAAGRKRVVYRALRLVAIVCAALVFGLTLSHVLQAPGSRRLPAAAWLEVQHTFYGGFAIIGGIAEIVGLLSSLLLAVLLWRSSRTIADARTRAWVAPGVAAATLLGTLAAYWVGNRPVNANVAMWTEATLPGDWSSGSRDVGERPRRLGGPQRDKPPSHFWCHWCGRRTRPHGPIETVAPDRPRPHDHGRGDRSSNRTGHGAGRARVDRAFE